MGQICPQNFTGLLCYLKIHDINKYFRSVVFHTNSCSHLFCLRQFLNEITEKLDFFLKKNTYSVPKIIWIIAWEPSLSWLEQMQRYIYFASGPDIRAWKQNWVHNSCYCTWLQPWLGFNADIQIIFGTVQAQVQQCQYNAQNLMQSIQRVELKERNRNISV